jgi:RimJ/RimL family protein N-acetyltransferase
MPEFSLRRARPEDAEAIHAIRTHPLTRTYQPMQPGTIEDLRRALTERGSLPLTPDQSRKVQWTIVVDGAPAGWVALDITSRDHHIADLGYALEPGYHGRGITSAAVRRVIPIAFDPDGLALERLQAVAAVNNTASRRVLEKCGFQFEGIARGYLLIAGKRIDHARYDLLRTDAAARTSKS